MKARELILLSSYMYPAGNPLTLSDEDMASWMNAYTALWHPAVLWGALEPPRVDVPYDYEDPQAHHVYAVPESPPMIMPDDWAKRVQHAGAVLIEATTDRDETMKKALAVFIPEGFEETVADEPEPADEVAPEPDVSLRPSPLVARLKAIPAAELAELAPPTPDPVDDAPEQPTPDEIHARLLALPLEQVRPFYAVGLGYLLLHALAEAMEHENLLETESFWDDVQQAIAALVGLPVERPEVFDSTDQYAMTDDGYIPPYDGSDDYVPPPASLDAPTGEQPEDLPEDPAYDGLPGEEGDYPEEYYEDEADQDYDYDNYDDSYAGTPSSFEGRFLIDPAQADTWLAYLHSATGRILSAREVLYPVTIYLLDIFLPDYNNPAAGWPASFARTIPVNVVAPSSLLEKWQLEHHDLFHQLREGVDKEEIEICGGCYVEREDNLLPIESQLWNLLKGQAVAEELLGKPLEVFARKKFFAHPQLPLFLSSTGLNRALMLTSEDSALPQSQSMLVSWPAADGKQVDAFLREPFKTDQLETLFNLGHYLFKTTREDHSATITLLHGDKPAHAWYEDFLELARFGPIFGEWMTLSRYFNDVMAGESTETQSADEFHFDYLGSRVPQDEHDPPPTDAPVTAFARHLRLRRRLDACWSLAAMYRGLVGAADTLAVEEPLTQIEDKLETAAPGPTETVQEIRDELVRLEQQVLGALSDRLLSQATGNDPGYLIVNPCSFIRRVALELDRPEFALPVKDPVKACQLEDDTMRLVVEVPALGFAWFPRSGPTGTPPPTLRMRLADDTHVRNEFFEAEIDPKTGGVFSIADRRNPFSRLAQRLVFNPGSDMRATSVKATSVGPALGEIVSEGVLLGEQEQVLAKFRQRFRAWLGRPILEMRVEIHPEQPAAGYPWHAYYGCRFAWADERATLLRGVNGIASITTHNRPQTPDFLELRSHRLSTTIFPGGLPFLNRHENRMLDVILIPQGETTHTFDLAIGLDRNYPMQTALGLNTPVSLIATANGPPHVGAAGWLYHLDTPDLLLTSMRPGGREIRDPYADDPEAETEGDHFDAFTMRLFECGNQSGQAEFRCVRNPTIATQLDSRGERMLELSVLEDVVMLEVTPGDLNQLQIEFS